MVNNAPGLGFGEGVEDRGFIGIDRCALLVGGYLSEVKVGGVGFVVGLEPHVACHAEEGLFLGVEHHDGGGGRGVDWDVVKRG